MKGFENSKMHEEFGKKEFYIPADDHPCRDFFEAGFKKCSSYLELDKANIELLFVYPNISKNTVARVRRTNNYLKMFSGCDYIVEFSGEVYDGIPDDVKAVVYQHECEHMIVNYNKNDEPRYCLKDHDVKDFRSIIDEYGLNWFDTLTTTIFDLEKEKGKELPDNFIVKL